MADEVTQPFEEWLRLQRKGATLKDLAAALAEVNLAVLETGKAGTVTFTISIKPAGDDVSVTVTDKVAKKIPEHDRGQSIFFVDEDGHLQRSQQVLVDEKQPPLAPVSNLRSVAGGAQPVDPETGEVR